MDSDESSRTADDCFGSRRGLKVAALARRTPRQRDGPADPNTTTITSSARRRDADPGVRHERPGSRPHLLGPHGHAESGPCTATPILNFGAAPPQVSSQRRPGTSTAGRHGNGNTQ